MDGSGFLECNYLGLESQLDRVIPDEDEDEDGLLVEEAANDKWTLSCFIMMLVLLLRMNDYHKFNYLLKCVCDKHGSLHLHLFFTD
jgi:hypothetical protein